MIATKEGTKTVVTVGVNKPLTLSDLTGAEKATRDKILFWVAPVVPLVISAVLNLWNLAQNGYSNLYYSGAVQSMRQSFHNFFFASYDAGGFITVDKPPVALWLQAISSWIFGFNPLSLLMPEALAGVASVAIIYFLVKRIFGILAGFVAALAMALTPIAVAVERTNNTDTLLMFILLLAAWALSIATENGQFKMLALSLTLVGVAFNIKMLVAFIVLPTFYLLYLVTAPLSWQKRLLHLTLGSIVVFAVALSWPLAVDLTPPDQRPWVGGSQGNSVLELALGYNGLGRVTGNELPGGRGGPRGPSSGPRPQGNFPPPGSGGSSPLPGGFENGAPVGGPGGPVGMFGAGQPGVTRLFTGEMAGQWSWLFPMLAFGFLAASLSVRRKLPLERRGQAMLLWGGWLLTYGVVFSIASGIFHPYYLIMLAPAAAALVGIGLSSLWAAYRRGGWRAWLLPVAVIATALWQTNVLNGYPQWGAWLMPLLLGGSFVTALGLVGLAASKRLTPGLWRAWSPGLVGISVMALLLAPLAWSVTPVLAGPSNASLPVAGPEALNQNDPTSWTRMNASTDSRLVSYLEANQDGYFYLVAVTNSQQASSIALQTGKPVLATGGFMGSDPALTVEKLQEMVTSKQVRFVMGLGGRGGIGMRGGMGGSNNSSVNNWIQQNCTAVDSSLYQGESGLEGQVGGFGGPFGLGNSQLYNCAAR